MLAQTISKLLDYTIEQHQRDPEGVTAKLRALEEQCATLSDLLYQKFHRGELGDAEEFFRPGRLKLDIDFQSGLIGITLSAGQAQKG